MENKHNTDGVGSWEDGKQSWRSSELPRAGQAGWQTIARRARCLHSEALPDYTLLVKPHLSAHGDP